mgnify:CR=1 FL=1
MSKPERILTYSALSIPHPLAFFSALKNNKSQNFKLIEAMNFAKSYDYIAYEYTNFFNNIINVKKYFRSIDDVLLNERPEILTKLNFFGFENCVPKKRECEKYNYNDGNGTSYLPFEKNVLIKSENISTGSDTKKWYQKVKKKIGVHNLLFSQF